jgi:hypothetical protein
MPADRRIEEAKTIRILADVAYEVVDFVVKPRA